MIVVEDAAKDHLLFHLPILPPGGSRVLVTAFGIIVSTVWLGMNLFAGNGVDGIADAVFAAAGLVPLAFCVMATRGRITVDLTRERLLVRWHCGRFGPKKELATPAIHRIVIIASVAEKHGHGARQPANTHALKVCLVFAGKNSVSLTKCITSNRNRRGGLIRYQLEQMDSRSRMIETATRTPASPNTLVTGSAPHAVCHAGADG
jgi:hypothetical protein